MKGYTYILHCSDGSYYTGSTKNLALRLEQHQAGEGANYTRKRLPVKLIYYEEYNRIDEAFYREKQIQGWSRKKKEALIEGKQELLPKLAVAYRDLRTLREPQRPDRCLTLRVPQRPDRCLRFSKAKAEEGSKTKLSQKNNQ